MPPSIVPPIPPAPPVAGEPAAPAAASATEQAHVPMGLPCSSQAIVPFRPSGQEHGIRRPAHEPPAPDEPLTPPLALPAAPVEPPALPLPPPPELPPKPGPS